MEGFHQRLVTQGTGQHRGSKERYTGLPSQTCEQQVCCHPEIVQEIRGKSSSIVRLPAVPVLLDKKVGSEVVVLMT